MAQDMNGVIAVNSKRLHASDFREWAIVALHKLNLGLLIAVCGGIGIAILLTLLAWFQSGQLILNTSSISMMFLGIILLIVYRFILPGQLGNTRYRKYMQMNEGVRDRQMLFYSDCLVLMLDGTEANRFYYSNVKTADLRGNVLILRLSEGQNVIVRRDGFSVGSAEDIKARVDSCLAAKKKK